jgi:uncharacterized membrane-anchored protein YitT (DUF2179 family)
MNRNRCTLFHRGAAKIEQVSKERTQCSYTSYNDADTIFRISPEHNIGDAVYEKRLASGYKYDTGNGGYSQRYSSVLVRLTVYASRMQADKLALEE